MLDSLKDVLSVQELDMKMLRLLMLKKKLKGELGRLRSLREELEDQLNQKQSKLKEVKKDQALSKLSLTDYKEKREKLEGQQASVKKVDEFNALSREISTIDREIRSIEQSRREIEEQQLSEEAVCTLLKDKLEESAEGSRSYEEEVKTNILRINEEGRKLKTGRDKVAGKAEAELLSIYDRLFLNKRDRVIVPIAGRACSGCHMQLTAQHENLVRKGERLVFCEHCSRLHYWQESEVIEGSVAATKRRGRRARSST